MTATEGNTASVPPVATETGKQRAQSPVGPPRRPGVILIRDLLIPMQIKLASGDVSPEIDVRAFELYRDAIVREAGSRDVLEQCLLEQVAAAHLASLCLQARCGIAQTPEAAGIYAASAAKLMGEMRRSIVAIKEMRSPTPPANITIAATQQVDVSGKAEPNADAGVEKVEAQSEVGSNNAPGSSRMRQIFGEDDGRAQEPDAARTADRSRAAAPA